MRIFQKKQAGHQPQTRIEKRVSMLSTPDLVSWAETSLYSLGRNLQEWNRNDNEDALDEFVLGAEAYLAIAKELKRRTKVAL